MTLGTLGNGVSMRWLGRSGVDIQPEDELKADAESDVDQYHTPLAQPVRGFGEDQPSQHRTTVEACRDVAHLRDIPSADLDQVLDHPAAGRDGRAEEEEEEEADGP